MIVEKYWEKIFRRAKEKIKGTSKLIDLIIFLISSFVAYRVHSLIAGEEEAIKEWYTVLIYFFIGVVLTYLILTMYYLITEPAVLHDELGGFVEKPIVISPAPYPEELGRFKYWRSFRVENITSIDVLHCMLYLVDVFNLETGKSIIRTSEDLTWSSREKESAGDLPKTIPGKLYKICDFAIWDNDSKEAIITLAFGKNPNITIGEFLAIIRISGKWQDKRFHYNTDIYFSFDGQKIIFENEDY